MPYSPVSVSTSDGLIGAASTSTSACPAPSTGRSNSTARITSCGTGPRSSYWAFSMGMVGSVAKREHSPSARNARSLAE